MIFLPMEVFSFPIVNTNPVNIAFNVNSHNDNTLLMLSKVIIALVVPCFYIIGFVGLLFLNLNLRVNMTLAFVRSN
ncbi:hypothetical protein [Vibrio gallaecicus]|uniref:hypothetical protein n=1 Tax=Vibrio gallaecicus TaxID=552386 RepID=UPI0025B48202|nr:hypothetical protein [Vibrio gallaecicus]MDN3616136.1 hypothetical protein [Vibrio gallaecicus]